MAIITNKNNNPFDQITIYSQNGTLYITIPEINTPAGESNIFAGVNFSDVGPDLSGDYILVGRQNNTLYILDGGSGGAVSSIESTTYCKPSYNASNILLSINRSGGSYTIVFKDTGGYLKSNSGNLAIGRSYTSGTCDWYFSGINASASSNLSLESESLPTDHVITGTAQPVSIMNASSATYPYITINSTPKFQLSSSIGSSFVYLFKREQSTNGRFIPYDGLQMTNPIALNKTFRIEYYIVEDNSAANNTNNYHPEWLITHYNYAENNNGKVVPVLYRSEDDGTYLDTEEAFFFVEKYDMNGETFDKWRKIETDGQYNWTGSGFYILTQELVYY